jgi:IPT/TIG domain
VPDGDRTYEYPEELLAGADRPRPLPPLLRSRLEEALGNAGLEVAAAETAARPLSAEVRDKLETTLRLEEPAEDRPGPSPEKKWRTWAPRLTVVAAVLIALGIYVPSLAHGPGPGANHTAAGAVGSGAASTASTQGSRSGLSAVQAVPPKAAFLPANGGVTSGSSSSSGSSESSGSSTASSVAAPPAVRAPAPTAPPPTAPPAVLAPNKSALGRPSAAFAATAPVVGQVTPHSGPAAGGNWVTLRGANMSGASAVYFGRVPAVRVTAVSATEVKALAPAHPAGVVDVVVNGPNGRSQVSPSGRYSFTS